MTPETEKTLRLLIDLNKSGKSITLNELIRELSLPGFGRAAQILCYLRDKGYISKLNFRTGLESQYESIKYDIEETAREYFYNLEVEAKVKEELRNQAKQQHRHDVFLLLIGGIISLILDNIGNIFLFLKSLFTT